MLSLYSIYHLNIMFSSIDEEDRITVINKCYWPLLRIADKGYPIGIELTGITLEIINSIDYKWIQKLKKLINESKVELIGSGYSQIISPLIPSEVNDYNQKLGLKTYQKILGITPKIALVNEMAFSSGIIEHYTNNGYEAIIMEWNNPKNFNKNWNNQFRYYPQKALSASGNDFIHLIWADSIAFQKFQRFVHGEMNLDHYKKYLLSQNTLEDKFFPLYSSDAEIFDFRPGRFNTEIDQNFDISEWDKIEDLLRNLSDDDNFKFILPSELLKIKKSSYANQELNLQSVKQPIPVKKQQKYNINRWALSGRNDLWLNTTCYNLYIHIKPFRNEEYFKKLCFFWSSDFRTHLTEKRWLDLLEKIKVFKNEIGFKVTSSKKNMFPNVTKHHILDKKIRYQTVSNDNFELELDILKGCSIKCFKYLKQKVSLFGTLEHGFFENIEYGVDFFSGHSVINQLGKHKITDLNYANTNLVENSNYTTISSNLISNDVQFNKKITLYDDHLTLKNKIVIPCRKKQVIHPFHFTFLTEAWDSKSLYFKTHNGGSSFETFYFNNNEFNYGENLSFLISSKHGLGNTNGVIIIGDKDKKIVFSLNNSLSFLIPTIFFKHVEEDKFLLRLTYSAQEIDETFRISDNENIINSEISVSL